MGFREISTLEIKEVLRRKEEGKSAANCQGDGAGPKGVGPLRGPTQLPSGQTGLWTTLRFPFHPPWPIPPGDWWPNGGGRWHAGEVDEPQQILWSKRYGV